MKHGPKLISELSAMSHVPVYIRAHHLLCTGDGTAALKWGSTNIYTEDAQRNPVYSYTLIDGIMDAIAQAGTYPLFEIGFMPQALSTSPNPYRNSDTYVLDGGCFYPPNDYTKWGNLVRAWATHARDRYPDIERTWQWELWNEPDIGYWHGSEADYERLFDTTEAALHEVLPGASLGGPAVAGAGTARLAQFLQHCATGTNTVSGQTGTRLDMVSFHAKGGVAITDGHVRMNLGNQLSLHGTGFKAVAAVASLKQTPIVVSEADPDGCAACPASDYPEYAYRNSPAYAAYEVVMVKRSLELEARIGVKLRGLLTWAFTFPGSAYFAGYRVLASNGIHLPVLNAFKLLGRLDGERLAVTSTGARTLDDILANGVRQQADVDAMATRSGDAIEVLVWNYHDDLVNVDATPVSLNVTVPAAFGTSVRVSETRVDETHGDAYTIWVSQGSPAAPSADQLTALRHGMEPVVVQPEQAVDVTNGVVNVAFDLPRFGISLVTVTPANGGGGAAGEGGDAGAPGASSTGGAAAPAAADDEAGCGCSVPGARGTAWRFGAGFGLALLGASWFRRRRAR